MNQKSLSKQVAVVIMIIPLLIAAAYIQFQAEKLEMEQLEQPEAQQPENQSLDLNLSSDLIGIPFITDQEIRDPKTARKYNIQGYIKVKFAPETEKRLTVEKGKELNITIQLRFVSHNPNLTETEVTLNPKSRYGLKVGRYLGDNQGSVMINDLISYNPSGRVKLEAGQTLNVTMIIKIPQNFPSVSLPLRVVGILADVPVIHREIANLIV